MSVATSTLTSFTPSTPAKASRTLLIKLVVPGISWIAKADVYVNISAIDFQFLNALASRDGLRGMLGQ